MTLEPFRTSSSNSNLPEIPPQHVNEDASLFMSKNEILLGKGKELLNKEVAVFCLFVST